MVRVRTYAESAMGMRESTAAEEEHREEKEGYDVEISPSSGARFMLQKGPLTLNGANNWRRTADAGEGALFFWLRASHACIVSTPRRSFESYAASAFNCRYEPSRTYTAISEC
jgi:hypothetical protein